MANQTLAALAQYHNDPSLPYIGNITNQGGIMQSAIWEASSMGNVHQYTVGIELPDAAVLNVNGSMTPSTGTDELLMEQIVDIASTEVAAANLVKNYPSPMEFFRRNAPKFMEKIAQQQTAKAIKRWYEVADANSVSFKTAGALSTSDTTSIYFVKWEPGVNSFLYNSNDMGNGMVKIRPVSGGNVYHVTDPVTSTKVIPSYGTDYIASMGLLTASDHHVSRIYNIKNTDTFLPTYDLVNEALAAIEADYSGRVAIYCNYLGFRLLQKLKNTNIRNRAEDTELSRWIGDIDGHPIFIDQNITSVHNNG